MSSPEYQLNIVQQNEINEETTEQKLIRFQITLADVLVFWAWTLNPEQKKLQEKLSKDYLVWLKPGDEVEIWLESFSNYHVWIVFSNDWEIVKIKSDVYWNKKKKEWIRSFSTKDWCSRWFILSEDYCGFEKIRFFVIVPDSHKIESTRGMPEPLKKKLQDIYIQAWNPDTCYDLVNNLKYPEINKEI